MAGLLFVVALPLAVHAVDTGVNVVGDATSLSGTDIRTVIARIIQVALGLLGIIALGIVLYAGFLWMTAGGDDARAGRLAVV